MNIHVSKTPRREIGPKLLKPLPIDEPPHSFEKFVFGENTEQGKAALAKMEQHFQPTAPSHRDKHIEEG